MIGRAAMTPGGPVDPLALRILAMAPLTGTAAAALIIAGTPEARLALSVLAVPLVGLAIAAGAYRQLRVLEHPAAEPVAPPGRNLFNLLPFLAVAATAVPGGQRVGPADELAPARRDHRRGADRRLRGAASAARAAGEQAGCCAASSVQQAELEHLAMTDPLTGLANRTRFGTILAERLDAHRPAGVLLIDIDDFKTVNDTMGHAVGDQLLYEVAQRLRAHSAVLPTLPARLGGDEFAVLLDIDDVDLAEEAAARILPRAVGAVQGRRATAAGQRQRRGRAGRAGRQRRRGAAQRRHRDVRGQGGGQGRLDPVRAADAPGGGQPRPARQRTAQRHHPARTAPALPARVRPRRPAGSPAPRRWSAGTTRSAGWSRRAISSRWPNGPA